MVSGVSRHCQNKRGRVPKLRRSFTPSYEEDQASPESVVPNIFVSEELKLASKHRLALTAATLQLSLAISCSSSNNRTCLVSVLVSQYQKKTKQTWTVSATAEDSEVAVGIPVIVKPSYPTKGDSQHNSLVYKVCLL